MAALTNPGHGAFAITPHNTNNLARPTRGIYLGTAGDLKVDMADGTTVTFTAMAAGMLHALSVKRVYTTGTTAATIIGVY